MDLKMVFSRSDNGIGNYIQRGSIENYYCSTEISFKNNSYN